LNRIAISGGVVVEANATEDILGVGWIRTLGVIVASDLPELESI
jgi:hypothetical protein